MAPEPLPVPLSALLAQTLIAFTIEFDNEFEQRMPHRTTWGPARSGRGPWLVSMPMWANFLRYLSAEGTPLGAVQHRAERVNLAGLTRWGYVRVGPDPGDHRPAPARRDQLIRLSRAGQRAGEIWAPLTGEIEARWRERFGADRVEAVQARLSAVVRQLGAGLPRCLPVAGVRKQDLSYEKTTGTADDQDLPTLLSRALLAYTIDYERESRLSLAVSANVLRVLDPAGGQVRELPLRAGVSREAVELSLGLLGQLGCVELATVARVRTARLTDRGRRAQRGYDQRSASIEASWRERLGAHDVDGLRATLSALLEPPEALREGLAPYPEGWRANRPYEARTAALLADPSAGLAHYPMVSHRGGFPDGS